MNGVMLKAFTEHKLEVHLVELLNYSADRFLLTSRSSAIVSLIPFPLGSEIQGFGPSPMTKILDILRKNESLFEISVYGTDIPGGERSLQ